MMLDLEPIDALLGGAQAFLQLAVLIAARLTPIIQLVPFLGGAVVPQPAKMGLTFTFTVLLMPMFVADLGSLPTGYLFALCVVKETAIGFTMGFVAALVFESVRIAGQIIDQTRGSSMATAMVAQLKTQSAVTATFMYQFATALFLIIGGHLLFLRSMLQSYQTVGPFAYPNIDTFPLLMEWIARLAGDAILLGVMIALPVVVSILLMDLLLGLLNKAAPQINVFFLGMPLKSMLGIAMLCLGTSLFAEQLVDAFAVQLDAFSQVPNKVTQ